MNRQRSDFKDKTLFKAIKKGMPLIVSSIVLFAFACKSDIQKVAAFANEINLPEQSARNLGMAYTDTGKLQMKFFTPVLNHYTNTEKPYYEFPAGIEVNFYDENEKISSTITAKYTILMEDSQLWEARDSVVARNIETGEKIETEQMFWDQAKQRIYSKVFTKITNEDGIYYGEKGFEATQDLTYYRLIGSTGTVRVQDEE
jgi:LPS export ABC transporter protein LptC